MRRLRRLLPARGGRDVDAFLSGFLTDRGLRLQHIVSGVPPTSVTLSPPNAHPQQPQSQGTYTANLENPTVPFQIRNTRRAQAAVARATDQRAAAFTQSNHVLTTSFTERVMRERPCSYFPEVIARWEAHVESAVLDSPRVAACMLQGLDLREVQLLNAKLGEDEFVHPKPNPASGLAAASAAAMAAVAASSTDGDRQLALSTMTYASEAAQDAQNALPKQLTMRSASAKLLGVDEETEAIGDPRHRHRHHVRNTPDTARSVCGSGVNLFSFYSVVHFAAELDSPAMLRFVAEELIHGIPIQQRPDQHADLSQTAPMMMQVSSPENRHRWANAARVHTDVRPPLNFPGFETVVRGYADYAGYYAFHRAALANATKSLAFFVDRFGEEAMFAQRRLPSLLAAPGSWGAAGYHAGRNAVGCAIAAGATHTLDWVLARCPRQLQLNGRDLTDALIAAALEDVVQSFEYLADKKLLPSLLSDGHDGGWGTRTSALADAVLTDGLAAVLEECGCHRALYAAAEAGSASVLDWLIQVFGEEVLWTPDHHGATALHHAARGGNAQLLQQVLVERQKTDCPNAHRHVDDFDGHGRTPAMWCVQGGKKGRHVVDTLLTLEAAGSQWRVLRNEAGFSVADVGRACHRPFTKVARFMRLIPPRTGRGGTGS